MWQRNNRYVLHNKIYYRGTGNSSGAKATHGFVPLDFDENIVEDEQDPDAVNAATPVVKSGVYDMQGRQIATEQQVLDGTWRTGLAPGLYIVNGKKILVK